jgi:hypothetical protein
MARFGVYPKKKKKKKKKKKGNGKENPFQG